MSEANKNTELVEFKRFINQHPKLIKEIRRNGKSWQELYEQWVLLGEDDIHWEQFKDEADERSQEASGKDSIISKLDIKPELVKQVLKYTESIDINKLQEQVQQFSKTISTVQEIINQYQKPNQSNVNRSFDWFTD